MTNKQFAKFIKQMNCRFISLFHSSFLLHSYAIMSFGSAMSTRFNQFAWKISICCLTIEL